MKSFTLYTFKQLKTIRNYTKLIKQSIKTPSRNKRTKSVLAPVEVLGEIVAVHQHDLAAVHVEKLSYLQVGIRVIILEHLARLLHKTLSQLMFYYCDNLRFSN